ncbi:TOMM precursor leader peptide-binding protein [Kribbella sp. NPDC050124]|uniref:TOMM precursor leader peptide-binding protein n=1 Tax=Kribbella sp. NPDC050124 TaxID=3364114 RepID=UPI0037B375BC
MTGRLPGMRVLVGHPELTAALAGSAIPSARWVRAPYPEQREELPAVMTGADLVIAADDGAFPVLHSWVNTTGLRLAVPTLHVAVRGPQATVGPLVLPGEGPCYLCWRMRALACEQDFAAAMAVEEELDARRSPDAAQAVLPALLEMVTRAELSDGVLALDAGTGVEQLHPVLPRPDCPACAKSRQPPTAVSIDMDDVERRTVDRLCGVVRVLELMPKDVDEPERPYVVRAELANAHFRTSRDAFISCTGKGWTRRAARDTAIGEALERYAAMTWQPERRLTSTYDGLDRPGLHPRDLVLFADHQYDDLPYEPWRPETELEWVPAQSLVTGQEVWIPLLATHLAYRSPAALFPATSNGFAAGLDRDSATLRALLEVVERDAFAIAWTHRLPGRCVAAADVPDEVVQGIASTHARRGVELTVHLLPTDTTATAVLAVAWSDRAPAAVIGTAAAMDPVAAARSAVLEVAQVRPLLRSRLRLPAVRARMAELAAVPGKVATLDDHDLLYAAPAAVDGLRFLWDNPRMPWPDTSPDDESLTALVQSLAAVAPDVLAVDVTPPDVEAVGVRVVRGLVPGFVPIWFGANQARLGGSRLLELPARLGLRPAPARLDELNLAPHPLA